MTCSFAGTPFGKSAARRPSRLRALLRLFRGEAAARARVVGVRRCVVPATPWARLRCTPKEAGRVNVLPHSGQTNVPDDARAGVVLVVVFLRVTARVAFALLFRF